MTTRVVVALAEGDARLAELRAQSATDQRVAEVLRGAAIKADAIRGRVCLWFFLERQRIARLGAQVDLHGVSRVHDFGNNAGSYARGGSA